MKRIYSILSAALSLAVVFSCSETGDNSEWDHIFAEDYNQEINWDVDALAFSRAEWSSKEVTSGVYLKHTQVEMMGAMQSVSYLTYAPIVYFTQIAETGSPMRTLSQAVEADHPEADFAISGGPFSAAGASSLVYIEGETKNEGTGDMPIIGMKMNLNGDVRLSCDVALDFESSEAAAKAKYTSALATSPALVIEGKAQKFPDTEENITRMARSVFGMNKNGECVFLVIDSGVEGEAAGTTMEEAARICVYLGLEDAVCLNSGDPVTIWTKENGVANKPSAGSEKAIANYIYMEPNTLFERGKGIESEPYVIANAEQIQNMKYVLKRNDATYFELSEDIDMEGIKDWKGLNAYDGNASKIMFDGKGHTIYNFYCNDKTYAGFFGVLWGECKNVKFENALIESWYNSNGILGGYIGTTDKPGLVENCYIHGKIVYSTNGDPYGGISGKAKNATIRNCYVDVDLSYNRPMASQPSINFGVGGIVGEMSTNNLIENCFVTGVVSGGGAYNTGGLVGRMQCSNTAAGSCTIQNNISWCEKVEGRVATGAAVGRWDVRYMTSSAPSYFNENHYKEDMTIITYNDKHDGGTQGIYHGSDKDFAAMGTASKDACASAKTLKWNEEVWDLTGETPQLKLFL